MGGRLTDMHKNAPNGRGIGDGGNEARIPSVRSRTQEAADGQSLCGASVRFAERSDEMSGRGGLSLSPTNQRSTQMRTSLAMAASVSAAGGRKRSDSEIPGLLRQARIDHR